LCACGALVENSRAVDATGIMNSALIPQG